MVWRSNFNGKEWKPALAVARLVRKRIENGKYESAREHGMHALRHFSPPRSWTRARRQSRQ